MLAEPISIAIETSCRRGGLALGAGAQLVEAVSFPADQRHATQLLSHLDQVLGRHGLAPADLREAYVSAGPGSFTGLRVGLTCARTLAQALPHLRTVEVPTAEAVAENAGDLDCPRLGVVMDAKESVVFVTFFTRGPTNNSDQLMVGGPECWQPAGPGQLVHVDELPAVSPRPAINLSGLLAGRPAVLIGEALWHHPVRGEGITLGPEELWLPKAEGVWRAGRRRALAGGFVPYAQLRPIYLRQPEAVRLWEKRQH